MLGVCRRYIKDLQFAEDVMIMGFIKVFNKLNTFRFEGNFEGWIRRIMIREAITFLRKKQIVVFDEDPYEHVVEPYTDTADNLDVAVIQRLIDGLPEGYKMVFVLFAVEGYKHVEISEMLQISESTSRSQLFKARTMLQAELRKLDIKNTNRRITKTR